MKDLRARLDASENLLPSEEEEEEEDDEDDDDEEEDDDADEEPLCVGRLKTCLTNLRG